MKERKIKVTKEKYVYIVLLVICMYFSITVIESFLFTIRDFENLILYALYESLSI